MVLLISGGHICVTKLCIKIWRLHTSSTKVRETQKTQITQKLWAIKDLRLGQIVYIVVFYNISFSWLLPLDGFQLIFCAVFIA